MVTTTKLTAPPRALALSLVSPAPAPRPFRQGDFEEVSLKPQTLPAIGSGVGVMNEATAVMTHTLRVQRMRRSCPVFGLSLQPVRCWTG